MTLPYARHQQRDGMIAKILRKIGDTDAVVAVVLPAPERLERGWVFRGGPGRGAAKLRFGRIRQREKLDRRQRRLARKHIRFDPGRFLAQIAPIADLQPCAEKIAARLRVIGIANEHGSVIRRGGFEVLQFVGRIGAAA